MPSTIRLPLWLPALALLAGCASPPASPPDPATTPVVTVPGDGPGWHAVPLPGKTPTHYAWTRKDGHAALGAVSEASASMYRQRVQRAPAALGDVSFSWWVQDLVAGANVADAAREDAPARVIFAFGGDHASLTMRTRALFELAEALTGEKPP